MSNKTNSTPPVWIDRFLRFVCPENLQEEILGDLHEQFGLAMEQQGVKHARRWYFLEVVKFARPYFIKRQILNSFQSYRRRKSSPEKRYAMEPEFQPFSIRVDMILNYFTIARRNLVRHKSYTMINLCGLVLGMACAVLIFSLVSYHLGFDNFHTKSNRIYRVTSELHHEKVSQYGTVPAPLGAAVRQDYSFVEKAARVITFGGVISLPSTRDNLKFQESDGVAYVEPDFLEIMDFPLLIGNTKTCLSEPNTAIITESMAKKYFPKGNPVGQVFKLDFKTNFTITGILKNLPVNTDRNQEIYLSYSTINQTNAWLDTWGGIYGTSYCYVLLKPGVSEVVAEKALTGLSKKYYDAQDAHKFHFKLQPLSDVHFNTELGDNSRKNQLTALFLIGVFLVVTACVNFVNLATAQALSRSKEIGVRKVLGSLKGQLFWQFIMETTVITTLAFVIALGLAILALPYMNEMLESKVSIDFLHEPKQWMFAAMLLIAVIFISGAYPGLVLAGFQPITALKGKLTQQQIGGFSLRKGLVVTQFAISQALLIGTIVITGQMKFNSQADMGFNKEAIVMMPVPDTKPSKTRAMGDRLQEIPGVEKVSFCNAPPASPQNNSDTGIRYASRPELEKFTIYFKAADTNYLSLFGISLVAGRNLAQSDTIREFLLNETTVKKLGLKSAQEAIGKKVTINSRDGIVVGIVKDFHVNSFRQKIDPVCLTTQSDNYGNCAVKISKANLPATLSALEKVWKEVNPEYIYEYEFLDEHLQHFYETDQLILQMLTIFSIIAIVIGCLGLYGLIAFMAAQKTKEIGVRKTLGASLGSIIWLFGKQFSQLLVIAFCIAAPFAWWVMNGYLSDFQYHINLGAGIFLSAIGITFLIAVLTIGYRSCKAALTNPVKSLRSE